MVNSVEQTAEIFYSPFVVHLTPWKILLTSDIYVYVESVHNDHMGFDIIPSPFASKVTNTSFSFEVTNETYS